MLVALLVPAILMVLSRRKKLVRKVLFDWYVFQIYHSLIRGFLLFSDQRDWASTAANKRYAHNHPHSSMRAWSYGNLEDLLYLALNVTDDTEQSLSATGAVPVDAIAKFKHIADSALAEVDRLVPWSTDNAKLLSDLQTLRVLVTVLRDQLSSAANLDVQRDPALGESKFREDLRGFLQTFVQQIHLDFSQRRQFSDRVQKREHFSWAAKLALTAIWLIPSRPVLRTYAKIRRKPYVDPLFPSMYIEALKEWREARGWTKTEAAEHFFLTNEQYDDYEMGYEDPPEEKFKEQLRFWIENRRVDRTRQPT